MITTRCSMRNAEGTTMPDTILVEAYMDNVMRCYVLCDRKAP